MNKVLQWTFAILGSIGLAALSVWGFLVFWKKKKTQQTLSDQATDLAKRAAKNAEDLATAKEREEKARVKALVDAATAKANKEANNGSSLSDVLRANGAGK